MLYIMGVFSYYVIKVACILLMLIVTPSTQALLWENFETKYVFSTQEWEKIYSEGEYKISAGWDSWAIWNDSIALIYQGYNLVKIINFNNVKKLWVGGNHILVMYGNKTLAFISFNNNQKKYLHTMIDNAILTEFGAIMMSNNSVYIINWDSFSYREFTGYRFGCVNYWKQEFLIYKNKTLLDIRGNAVAWKVDFDSEIKSVSVTSDNYFVLCKGNLYVLNNNHIIVYEIQSDGNAIYGATHFAVIEEMMTDDEGKKQWLFTVLSLVGGEIKVEGKHVSYLPPKNCTSFGNYIAFYDSQKIHILNSTNHICTNNMFERFAISGLTLVGENYTGIYALTYDDLNKSLKNLGKDSDLDSISDSDDPDDDNDGMPDWWEKKYGLNPLDPSDRNLDFDGDGLTNYQEYLYGTNPLNWDTDDDGISDGYEIAHGLDPLHSNVKSEFSSIFVKCIIIIIIIFVISLGVIGLLKRER